MRKAMCGALLTVAVTAAATATASAAESDTGASLRSVVDAGAIGVQAQVIHGDERWEGTSGHRALHAAGPMPAGGRFRIGSITKSFTATALMQLVAKGEVDLDSPVECYLPGTVPNGRHITVRQLLNHTSGIFGYTEVPGAIPTSGQDFLDRVRFRSFSMPELAAIGVNHAPYFEPGASWMYSNTNYVLVGMIIESVTGHSYAHVIRRGVIEPLGLAHTSVPANRTTIPGRHARGYLKITSNRGTRTVDVTRQNPSWAGPAGEIISTPADVNTFFQALLTGRLVPAPQLAEMKKTVAIPQDPAHVDTTDPHDGLGITRHRLSCGVQVWGHDGGIHGYLSDTVHTETGESVTVSANLADFAGPDLQKISAAMASFEDATICDN